MKGKDGEQMFVIERDYKLCHTWSSVLCADAKAMPGARDVTPRHLTERVATGRVGNEKLREASFAHHESQLHLMVD